MLKINNVYNLNRYFLPCSIFKNIHMPSKSNSPLHYKYAPDIKEAVNKQVQSEQEAAQYYLNIAVKLLHPCQLRRGAGGFFMRMYEEELRHMQQFIIYQLKRGGTPSIGSVKEPPVMSQVSLLEAFRKALELEKNITESLENIITLAEKAKDYHCADFVTSKFLTEQMSSMDELSQHIVNLCKLSDNQHALYHYDLELAKRYPYKYALA